MTFAQSWDFWRRWTAHAVMSLSVNICVKGGGGGGGGVGAYASDPARLLLPMFVLAVDRARTMCCLCRVLSLLCSPKQLSCKTCEQARVEAGTLSQQLLQERERVAGLENQLSQTEEGRARLQGRVDGARVHSRTPQSPPPLLCVPTESLTGYHCLLCCSGCDLLGLSFLCVRLCWLSDASRT